MGDRREITRQVGERIRAARDAADCSQLELASRIGRVQASICHWETGQRAITAPDLLLVAEALAVSASRLLPGAFSYGAAHDRAVAALTAAWPHLADDLVHAEQLAHVVLGSLDLIKEAEHG